MALIRVNFSTVYNDTLVAKGLNDMVIWSAEFWLLSEAKVKPNLIVEKATPHLCEELMARNLTWIDDDSLGCQDMQLRLCQIDGCEDKLFGSNIWLFVFTICT